MMSSPRQKMVLLGPPQPNEFEQRKKRQTLERAKASHLSRQLQMRLQYAKLKVEHGWQRQNLNEVENLYFHHSHQRSMRQGATQRPHYATATSSVPAETQSPALPDLTVVSSPPANDAPSPSPVSPPSEHAVNADSQPLLQPQSQLAHTPIPLPTTRPSSALDLTDPNIMARLAQWQAQSQTQTQQTLSRQSVTVPLPPSTSTPQPGSVLSMPIPVPNTFPQSGPLTSAFAPQPLGTPISIPRPNSVTYSIPTPTSQPPTVPTPAAPAPTTAAQVPIPIPTTAPTPIAPTALTYDSFWSTHASSTGPTRALYRTHTGFTASATPGGNVAMLTPGGHAAVMTAEGVYVGGGTK